jgi:hypothetical protein
VARALEKVGVAPAQLTRHAARRVARVGLAGDALQQLVGSAS